MNILKTRTQGARFSYDKAPDGEHNTTEKEHRRDHGR